MLTLAILLFVLLAGLAAYAALGVEDSRFHADHVPVKYETMSPAVMLWEASLPGKPKLPWDNATNGEWIAAIEK